MLVGDAMARSRTGTKLKRQNCYRCHTGPNFGGDVSAPCMDGNIDTEYLPKKKCPGGIRSNILFPTYVIIQLPPTNTQSTINNLHTDLICSIAAGTARTSIPPTTRTT